MFDSYRGWRYRDYAVFQHPRILLLALEIVEAEGKDKVKIYVTYQ